MPSKNPSGELLKEARRLSGLSQRALAAKARTVQSVVARIELGLASPSVDTLSRLLDAAGFELGARLEPRVSIDPTDLAESARLRAIGPEARLAPPAGAGASATQRLIPALGWHKVAYVLTGVLAARLRGMPRYATRVEVTPSRELSNLKALAAALRELGPRVFSESVPDGLAFDCSAATLGRAAAWDLVTAAGRVAVVFEPVGTAGYDDLRRGATEMEVYGTAVSVASLADVIRTVAAVNRPEDRSDLLLLRAIASEGNPA